MNPSPSARCKKMFLEAGGVHWQTERFVPQGVPCGRCKRPRGGIRVDYYHIIDFTVIHPEYPDITLGIQVCGDEEAAHIKKLTTVGDGDEEQGWYSNLWLSGRDRRLEIWSYAFRKFKLKDGSWSNAERVRSRRVRLTRAGHNTFEIQKMDPVAFSTLTLGSPVGISCPSE